MNLKKIEALGRAAGLKGGADVIEFLAKNKNMATRSQILGKVPISKGALATILNALKAGELVLASDSPGSIVTLSPGVSAAISAIDKPYPKDGPLVASKGKMVARFTREATPSDPIVEGVCGQYSFTATTGFDDGVWDTTASHFVMRDTKTGLPCAKHDPDHGWTMRPRNSKQIAHLEMIRALFDMWPQMK